jgi:hypothetical protein
MLIHHGRNDKALMMPDEKTQPDHLMAQSDEAEGAIGAEEQAPQHLPTPAASQAPAHSLGPQFDATPFANSADFDRKSISSLDHEHLHRAPSGYSVIDVNSVYDDSGRSFHGYKQGKYFLPNDAVTNTATSVGNLANETQAEQDRLDLQHATLQLLLDGKLYLAPIQNPEHVLDVATGTGIWANQFGR